MATEMKDLRVLKAAESIADGVWKEVTTWSEFARDTVGKQMTRAVDSIGANVAESYGRFHYGEKIQFLYYARGSLFETKYWLRRAHRRQLMSRDKALGYAGQLEDVARQLNAFVNSLKEQRAGRASKSEVHETPAPYLVDPTSDL